MKCYNLKWAIYSLRLDNGHTFPGGSGEAEFAWRLQLVAIALTPTDRKEVVRVGRFNVTGHDLHAVVEVHPHEAVNDFGDRCSTDLIWVVRVHSLQLHAFLKLVTSPLLL